MSIGVFTHHTNYLISFQACSFLKCLSVARVRDQDPSPYLWIGNVSNVGTTLQWHICVAPSNFRLSVHQILHIRNAGKVGTGPFDRNAR
jgi:hypothetical protein